MITEPGVYQLTDAEYFADPVPGGSLSSSGARRLLPPSCPALFDYERQHGEGHKRTWDIGHAAHLMVLGTGPELVVIDATDYRTKAAQEAQAAARADGKVPLLVAEHAKVREMAAALRAHPFAGALLNPEYGTAEQSLFWFDEEFGIWRRARPDFIRTGGKRVLVADYKSTSSAEPAAIARSVANYGYHRQHPWYLDGIAALDIDPDAAFVFVFQEKTPPYLVTVVELDPDAVRIGRELNRRAMEIYRDCQASGVWPGYSSDVEQISLPRWAESQMESF